MAGSTIWDYMQANQPSPFESLAGAIPFLGLPKQEDKYYQPFYNTANAMSNMDSPQFQNIYRQQKDYGQQNLAAALMEASNQNRKLSMMGRTPLFDPERGGEQQFRGLMQGYQDVGNQASTNTHGILNNAAQMQALMAQQRTSTAQKQAGISGNLFGALAKILGL